MEVTLFLTHVLLWRHTASMSRMMAVAKPRRRVRTQPAAATAELLAALSQHDVSHPSSILLQAGDTLREQPRFYTSR